MANKFIVITSNKITAEVEDKISDYFQQKNIDSSHWIKNIWLILLDEEKKAKEISLEIGAILISNDQDANRMIFSIEDNTRYALTLPSSAIQWLKDKFFKKKN